MTYTNKDRIHDFQTVYRAASTGRGGDHSDVEAAARRLDRLPAVAVIEIAVSLTRSGVPLQGFVTRPPSIVEVKFP